MTVALTFLQDFLLMTCALSLKMSLFNPCEQQPTKFKKWATTTKFKLILKNLFFY